MLQRPTDLRPCVNNFNVKYFRFVLKSKHQLSVARCLAISILQNGKSGVVGSLSQARGFGNLFERVSQRRDVQQGAVEILL